MRKPSGSKLQLRKGSDNIEFIIPTQTTLNQLLKDPSYRQTRHQIGLVSLVGLGTAIGLVLSIYMISILSANNTDPAMSIGLLVGLLFVLPPTVWLGMTWLRLMFDIAQKFLSTTHIRVSRKQVTLTNEFYNLKEITLRRAKTREIQKIVVFREKYDDEQSIRGTLVLQLFHNDVINLINTSFDVTIAELEYIGYKISNWLNVEYINDHIDTTET
jgi:hypothetical protein